MNKLLIAALISMAPAFAQAKDSALCSGVYDNADTILRMKFKDDPTDEVDLRSIMRTSRSTHTVAMEQFRNTPDWPEAELAIRSVEWLADNAMEFDVTYRRFKHIYKDKDRLKHQVADRMYTVCRTQQ